MRILMVGLDNAGCARARCSGAVWSPFDITRGAGKTTVVRKFNGESIDEICPTLGFNIKTMDFQVVCAAAAAAAAACDCARAGVQAESVGRGRSEEPAHVLAQLL